MAGAAAARKDVERQLERGSVKRNGTAPKLLDFDTKGIFVSIHQFCQETGKDRATVDKKLRLGLLKPMKASGGNPVYRLRDLIDLVFYRDDQGRVDIDRLDPFRRKAHYSAELDKMKMMQQGGQLVPIYEVEQEQARIAKVVTQFLDTLPDILERDCGATPQMLAKIEQRIDAAREDLYKAAKGDNNGSEADDLQRSGAGEEAPRGRAAAVAVRRRNAGAARGSGAPAARKPQRKARA